MHVTESYQEATEWEWDCDTGRGEREIISGSVKRAEINICRMIHTKVDPLPFVLCIRILSGPWTGSDKT